MSEEGQTQEAAPAEQAVEQTAVESIQQEKPNIMMDKEVASEMASKASDANSVESSDPIEAGLSKGMKISGKAGEPVAAPVNQIAPVSTQEGKTSARVSPVADVPADAQLNDEGSSPSIDPSEEKEVVEEKENVEEEQPETEANEETETVTETTEETEPEKEVTEETEPEEEVTEPETVEEEPVEETEAKEEVPEGAQPEQEPENTPFGDPLRNVVENTPQNRDIDRKTMEDSNILLTNVPGKLRIY